MNGEFLGKTAIITGGASGMGLLTGKRMYEDGANVVLVDGQLCGRELVPYF